MKRFIYVYILSLFLNNILNAQWVDFTFSGNDYDFITTKGDTVFAGGPVGIFISNDNGSTYAGIMNGLPQWPNVSDIAIFENKIFISISYDGVYISENNGATWRIFNTGLYYNGGVSKLCISNGYLFVAAAKYIYRTPLNEAKWTKVLEVNGGVTEIVANGSKIYAATAATGVYFSTDSGLNWIQNNDGIPPNGSRFHEIRTIGVNNEDDLFIGIRGYGVYKYNITEKKWKQSSIGITDVDNGVDTYYYGLKVVGNNVLVGNLGKVYLSTNKGNSFADISDKTYLSTRNLHMNKNFIYFAGAGIKKKKNNGLYTLTSSSELNDLPDMTVYPNPFKEFIAIENITEKITAGLFTTSGKLIKKTILSPSNAYLSTEDVQQGLYILKLESQNKKVLYKKVLKL